MPGLYTGSTGLWGGYTGLLFSYTSLSTPPGFLADAYSPAQLFLQGEQGAWYDPSDFSTMFQDSAGTTPVTAVQQPVGLILDKSKSLAIGPELVTNGDFSSATGWTLGSGWTISSDVLNGATGAFSEAWIGLSSVTGATYKVTLTMTRSAGNILVYISNGGNVSLNTSGTFTFYLVAGASGSRLSIGGQTFTGTIDNVSVKAIAGNHASQTTSTSRPVLSARVNLLTYTEDFSNAAWLTGVGYASAITSNSTTAPNGTTTADTLVADNAGGTGSVILARSVGVTTGTTYTYSFCAKKSTRSWIQLYLLGYTSPGNGGAFFNLDSGAVGTVSSGFTASISSEGDGWYRCSISFTAGSTVTGEMRVYLASANNSTTVNRNGTDAVFVWGADLRVTNSGTGLPPYQRVGAATDYSTSGFPYYLSFDGTDDFLVTGTINPGSVDKCQVFAGVRKLSDAAAGIIAEISVSGSVNSGTFTMIAASTTGGDYFFRSRGDGTTTGATATTYIAPITNVLSGLGDISGDSAILRVNGSQIAQNTADQGSGNFGSYPLYIGRRGGSSFPFNGRIYGLIVRFSSTNLITPIISQTEQWMNSKTLAY